MSSSRVAVLKTSPESVVPDYARLTKMAGFEDHLPKDKDTILKINISWHYYFPACSTTPWQLDGVTQALKDAGYKNLIPAQNRTVVVDPKLGARNNHLESVIDKHGLEFIYLYEEDVKWIKYEPKAKMLVLDKVFPEGILIPDLLVGKNAVHLPTLKTHVFTTMTGAMKNAFGGLLRENRHWTHSVIHETLVDLLAIQKEIHPGIFAVTDGTIAGDGPGPRAMVPFVKNYILASADQVAIDAVAAKLMGFDPMSIKYINLGHTQGLGVGDPREIELVGDDVSNENWHFKVGHNLHQFMGWLTWYGPTKFLQKLVTRTPLVAIPIAFSEVYHDYVHWPIKEKHVFKDWCETTAWGQLFLRYQKEGYISRA